MILAGAAFSGDEQRGGGVRDLARKLDDGLRRGIFRDPCHARLAHPSASARSGPVPRIRYRARGAPEAFEVVIVARSLGEDVHDEAAEIEQNPFCACRAFAVRQADADPRQAAVRFRRRSRPPARALKPVQSRK